jgi:hypothetical protein
VISVGTEKSRKLPDKRRALPITDETIVGNDDFVVACWSELGLTILTMLQTGAAFGESLEEVFDAIESAGLNSVEPGWFHFSRQTAGEVGNDSYSA